jgi:peroxiredoxin
VLRDETGSVAASYAPERAAPALKERHMVVIGSNVIIDREGKIRFFTLVDSRHFDAKLENARAALERLLAE